MLMYVIIIFVYTLDGFYNDSRHVVYSEIFKWNIFSDRTEHQFLYLTDLKSANIII
jgi:hypothetical protein